MTTKRKYGFLIAATALLAIAGGSIHARKDDFGLGRNMEITVNMMRELALGYVDPIDPDRLMEGAAAGMVSDLDPYTEYISEEGLSDFELLTTGKYGGRRRPDPQKGRLGEDLAALCRDPFGPGRAEDRRPDPLDRR